MITLKFLGVFFRIVAYEIHS